MSEDQQWLRDTLSVMQTDQKEGFRRIHEKVDSVTSTVTKHETQMNERGGMNDRLDKGEIKFDDNDAAHAKIDKKLWILGVVVLSGTGVATNLGPIGELLKKAFGF